MAAYEKRLYPGAAGGILTENAPLNLTLLFRVLSYFILTCNCGEIIDPRDYFIQVLIPLYELPLLSEIHVNTTLL